MVTQLLAYCKSRAPPVHNTVVSKSTGYFPFTLRLSKLNMAAARKKQKTANEDALEEVSKEYHPLFADPTADLVFESNDGILFRVKSWRMKVFR